MNALAYRDLLEHRFINYMKDNALVSKDAINRLTQFGTKFRNSFSDVIEWLPPEDKLKVQKVPIGICNLGGPNAICLLAPDKSPVIILDYSLSVLLLDFCQSLSPHSFKTGPWKPESRYAKVTRDQRMQWFFDTVAVNFHLSGWWLDQQWRVGNMDKSESAFFDRMFLIHIWFIIAHEMAHVALGHIRPATCKTRYSLLLCDDVVAFNGSHRMEYGADAYALNTLLNANLPSGFENIEQKDLASCIDTLFTLFMYLEGTGEVISGQAKGTMYSATHPSALMRADMLRQKHGYVNSNMTNLREYMMGYIDYFRSRWPSIQMDMRTKDGTPNVSLL